MDNTNTTASIPPIGSRDAASIFSSPWKSTGPSIDIIVETGEVIDPESELESMNEDEILNLIKEEKKLQYCGSCGAPSNNHHCRHRFEHGGLTPTERKIKSNLNKNQDIEAAKNSKLTECCGFTTKPTKGFTDGRYKICNYCFNIDRCMYGKDRSKFTESLYNIKRSELWSQDMSCDCNNCNGGSWADCKPLN
jgi:hypothetical protein